MFIVPSLNPNRLRGVDWLVEVVEVRPKPSCDQRTATVPKPIRARLRIAWTATWGSSAQAWTQRSPYERPGSSSSAGKCGSVRSAVGWRPARPNRSVPSSSRNSDGPKPKVIVSPLGGRPSASPVSSGGRLEGPSTGPIGPAGSPRVIRSAASVHLLSSSTSASRSVLVTSKAAKCSRSWAGVTMPAWCAPRKAYDAAARRRLAGRALADPADDERTGHPGRGRAAAEEATSGDSSGHGLRQHRRGELRQRLGEGVDRVGELLDLVGGELVVGLEAVADLLGVEQRLQLAKRVVELGGELGVLARRRSARRPRSRPGRRPRSPGSPRGRSATSTPPRR